MNRSNAKVSLIESVDCEQALMACGHRLLAAQTEIAKAAASNDLLALESAAAFYCLESAMVYGDLCRLVRRVNGGSGTHRKALALDP